MPLDGAYARDAAYSPPQSVSPPAVRTFPLRHVLMADTRQLAIVSTIAAQTLYIVHPGPAATERFMSATASASEVRHLLDRMAVG